MKQTNRIKRLFPLILTAAMLLGLMLPAHAATPETSALRFRQVDNSAVSAELRQDTADEIQDAPDYASTDLVRVSIVLDQKSTLEAGFSTADIAGNASAMSYRAGLRDNQADVAARIARVTKEPLDVVWNLTLAANIISANISYGQIQTIQNLPGVKDVVVETRYEPCVVDTQEAADPNMATSFQLAAAMPGPPVIPVQAPGLQSLTPALTPTIRALPRMPLHTACPARPSCMRSPQTNIPTV